MEALVRPGRGTAVKTPDHTPRLTLGRLLFGLRRRSVPPAPTAPPSHSAVGRDPPPEPHLDTPGDKPKSIFELTAWVLEKPERTRRLNAVIGTLGGCVAGIAYALQLEPDKWAYVAGVASSIVAIAKFRRRNQ